MFLSSTMFAFQTLSQRMLVCSDVGQKLCVFFSCPDFVTNYVKCCSEFETIFICFSVCPFVFQVLSQSMMLVSYVCRKLCVFFKYVVTQHVFRFCHKLCFCLIVCHNLYVQILSSHLMVLFSSVCQALYVFRFWHQHLCKICCHKLCQVFVFRFCHVLFV